MINREKLQQLVEVFYQPTFKTFYVNSLDSENFVRPLGVFVSLGITTSMKVLEDIRDIISETGGYNAVIGEISSVKSVGGQYLNTLEKAGSGVCQYPISEFPEGCMKEEEAREELKRMKELMQEDTSLDALKKYATKISKLQGLIEKLTETNGWALHVIQKDEAGDFKIYHKNINYLNEVGVEYRVGIYVSEGDLR